MSLLGGVILLGRLSVSLLAITPVSQENGLSASFRDIQSIDTCLIQLIRAGYFSTDAFVQWIANKLLPHYTAFPGPRSVIVMDNASAHYYPRIEEVITAAGCQVRYLPPYSPEFNPIELPFSVLKAWVRRYFYELWPGFDGLFGDFLRYAVARNRCNRFIEDYFRYSAGEYIFEADVRALEQQIEAGDI